MEQIVSYIYIRIGFKIVANESYKKIYNLCTDCQL